MCAHNTKTELPTSLSGFERALDKFYISKPLAEKQDMIVINSFISEKIYLLTIITKSKHRFLGQYTNDH